MSFCPRQLETKGSAPTPHYAPKKTPYLTAEDDNLWQLDGIRTDGVEHILQLVDHRNEGFHRYFPAGTVAVCLLLPFRCCPKTHTRTHAHAPRPSVSHTSLTVRRSLYRSRPYGRFCSRWWMVKQKVQSFYHTPPSLCVRVELKIGDMSLAHAPPSFFPFLPLLQMRTDGKAISCDEAASTRCAFFELAVKRAKQIGFFLLIRLTLVGRMVTGSSDLFVFNSGGTIQKSRIVI